MRDYVILTDVCADLTVEMVEEIGVDVLPMQVSIGETVFTHYYDAREMGLREFYDRIGAGQMATTSQVNPVAFVEYFKKYLDEGKDVLYISFSSGLSGSYSNSLLAIDEIADQYPEAKILSVDSLCACMGQALMVFHAVDLKRAGASIEEVRDYVLNWRQKYLHWVIADDLNHLKRGGRLSAGAALAGTLLHIKPIIHVTETGHLLSVAKVRGRRAAIEAVFKHVEEQLIEEENPYICIAHSDCKADMDILVGMIHERFPKIEIRTAIMGPVIGAHTGIGTIATFFIGPSRNPN